jgi:hypothetical protein
VKGPADAWTPNFPDSFVVQITDVRPGAAVIHQGRGEEEPMNWHSRVVRDDFGPEPFYSIHEVCYDDNGQPKRRTINPSPFGGRSLEELREELAGFATLIDDLPTDCLGEMRALLAEMQEALAKPVLTDVVLDENASWRRDEP